MTRGTLYLIGGEDGSRYTYTDDLIGLPILPGMEIYGSDAGASIIDLTSNTPLQLAP